LDHLDSWHKQLDDEADFQHSGPPAKKKKKKGKADTDLLIAKNPQNAYPIFQLFKKSERYTKPELLQAVECLNQADRQLKSGGPNAKLVLEKVILEICGRQDQSARSTA